MDNIFIKQGTRSPEITFDFNQNIFEIKGESYPDDPSQEHATNILPIFEA